MKNSILIILVFLLFLPFAKAQDKQTQMASNIERTYGMLPNLPLHAETTNQSAFFSAIIQTVGLLGGEWNWVSFFVEASDPAELLEMFKASAGDNVSQIESIWGLNSLEDDGWVDEFTELTYEDLYFIEALNDCTIELQGEPVDPADYPITIYPQQWNLIGFPCAEVVNLVDALAGFDAEDGDEVEGLVEGVGALSAYDEAEDEWIDAFDLTPGIGFLYWSNSPATSAPKTLIIQTGAKAKSRNVSMGKKALNLKATNKTDKGSVKAERVKNVMCKTYNQ